MPGHRQSLSEIIASLRASRRDIARICSEVDAVVVVSRERLAQSVELLAQANEVLVRRPVFA